METKRELQFKDIAGYSSYGVTTMRATTNVGISFLPVLRPISDLYKTIIHKGKEIIPIVELAKIHDDSCSWYLSQDENYNIHARSGRQIFYFEDGSFFSYGCGVENVYCQVQLFDWLDEHLFDYRGLIDAGLAVDVNTLEENPYLK